VLDSVKNTPRELAKEVGCVVKETSSEEIGELVVSSRRAGFV